MPIPISHLFGDVTELEAQVSVVTHVAFQEGLFEVNGPQELGDLKGTNTMLW